LHAQPCGVDWDFKISRPDLLTLWAGDIGIAAGVELRREEFTDNRDPRQDGTITFDDIINNTPPTVVNDLMGNSGSLDTHGERDVQSGYIELAAPLVSQDQNIPFIQSIDMQLAARYENFDTFGSVTKPKVAIAWRPFDFLLFRSAWSEGFRAPNLQQQFESGLQRANNRTDFIFCEADRRAGRITAAQFTTTCPGRAQSVVSNRQGSSALAPEESTNLTYGMVFESTMLPPDYGKITFTADWWRIEQSSVVGIFGDENHVLLDYVLRTRPGCNVSPLPATCFNPAVVRNAPDAQDQLDFNNTGIQAVGDIRFVNDNYLNLDERAVQGWDFGLYYDLDDTPAGDFSFRFNAAFLDKFFQGVSPDGAVVNGAAATGQIPSALSVTGQGNLVRRFGRPEWRYTSTLTWRKDAWGAGWFTSYVGDVYDSEIILAATQQFWTIGEYQTHNAYVQFEFGHETDQPLRLRVGVRNLFDEAPPLADTNFGYLGDLHNPSGRFIYVNARKVF
jgi:iron complex outermembrane recepter protein